MLERKITEKLIAWKNNPEKLCLLLKGARQVGKTYIIERFATDNYENYIYINFELMPEYKQIFEENLDFKTLKMNLEVNFPDKKIEKGKTLLFLDEIQVCPNARVALKTFAMDKTIDVIASGSLLGLYYKDVSSYPVGYEQIEELFPLDFEEFLWAMGVSKDVVASLRESFYEKKPLTESVLSKMNEYFRLYMLVGGMPAAVNSYLSESSLQSALATQQALIDDYKNDVIKYANTTDKQKILRTFESVPMQLAKKNKKFMLNDIDEDDNNASERKYGSAMSWLKDAGIVNFCYNLNEPALPLNANRRLESYKIYMRDTGLLISMLEIGTQKAILSDDLYINEGGIAENVCAGELAAHGQSLAYFERKSSLEIDFVLNIDGVVAAIEVKSGKNNQAKSLKTIAEKYHTVGRFIKFERTENVYVSDDGVEHYPLFMIAFLGN